MRSTLKPRARGTRKPQPTLDAELDELLLAMPNPAQTIARLDESLRKRGLYFGEGLVPTFLRPHLLEAPTLDRWAGEAEALFTLLEELAQRALPDRELCRWLGFSDSALELFRIDPGYRRNVVIARPDAIQVGKQALYVEANTDSPAMMTFADEIEAALLELEPLAGLASRFTATRRCEALLTALLACYREWGGKGLPSMAVVDWPGEKTAHELKVTVRTFKRLGLEAIVAAPHQLKYQRGKLWAGKRKIDFVYRRVLCNDFFTRADELKPLLSAYRDGKVCMANPLRSYLVGSKSMLALLHDETNAAGLTLKQRALAMRLLPWTLNASPHDRVGRRNWVLKKSESHGGQDVIIGALSDDATWNTALAKSKTERWVRQAFTPVSKIRLPVLENGRLVFRERFINWNPFIFGGKHGGSISRVSASELINITRGGGLLPTMRIEPKP